PSHTPASPPPSAKASQGHLVIHFGFDAPEAAAELTQGDEQPGSKVRRLRMRLRSSYHVAAFMGTRPRSTSFSMCAPTSPTERTSSSAGDTSGLNFPFT